MFVVHSWLQHAGAKYLGPHNMRYCSYLVLQNVSLNDDIIFSYGWKLEISESDRTDSAEGCGDTDDVLQRAEIEDG